MERGPCDTPRSEKFVWKKKIERRRVETTGNRRPELRVLRLRVGTPRRRRSFQKFPQRLPSCRRYRGQTHGLGVVRRLRSLKSPPPLPPAAGLRIVPTRPRSPPSLPSASSYVTGVTGYGSPSSPLSFLHACVDTMRCTAASVALLLLSAAASSAPSLFDFPVAPLPPRAATNLLSNVFGEHMVFQSDAPIEVWGFAPPNAVITVSLRGVNNATAVSSPAGAWRVTLASEAAGGPFPLDVSSSAGESSNFVDVYVGTVMMCSGQSNLSGDTTPVSYVFNATETIAEAADFPFVRVFKVGELGTPGAAPPPLAQLAFPPKIPWSVASPASVSSFSATCWMTAKVLAQTLGPTHPIGLIESAWSGTCIQAWLSADALPLCGTPPPAQPPMNANSTLFNQMIAPFDGFAVSGIIWYQVRVRAS